MQKILIYSIIISILFNHSALAIDLAFNKYQKPISLLGLREIPKKHDGCYMHSGNFIIDEIAYKGVSEMVGGIRVVNVLSPKEPPKLMYMDTESLSNYENSWIPMLVQKGNVVEIEYDICGNGGYHQVRDLRLLDSSE